MSVEEFKKTLTHSNPPETDPLTVALWYDANLQWDRAHDLAQDIHTSNGSWVHAYLHRKEGDEGNAAYWYHRAEKPICNKSLDEEWEEILVALLRTH